MSDPTAKTSKRQRTELGRRIQERMRQMDPPWNQAVLARKLGVSPQWVSDIMRQRFISAPTAVRLAEVLEVSVKYLAPEEGDA